MDDSRSQDPNASANELSSPSPAPTKKKAKGLPGFEFVAVLFGVAALLLVQRRRA